MTETAITDRLERHGITGVRTSEIMQEVAQLIIARVYEFIKERLSPEERAYVEACTDEEAQAYFAEHRGTIPSLSQEEFDTIHDNTWREFFESLQ